MDTFERAWRKAETYRGDGDVAAWLWGIAIRRLIDRMRKQVPVPFQPAAVTGQIQRTRVRLDDEVADRVLVASNSQDVAALLDRLAPELQAVLQATVLDGLSTKEAATLLGIPAGTVKSRAYRARAVLREELS